MYNEHFRLTEYPFRLTPDTSYYFEAQSYQEALDTIIVSLKQNEGFIKITGPVGSGKTLLCRNLLNNLPENFMAAYIPNPALPPVELYKMIIHELEGEVAEFDSEFSVHRALNHLLIETIKENKSIVLVIDEAQTMSDETLEGIRLLTNLETEKKKLLQIVLFGQTELDEKLSAHKFRQLKERIVFSYYLRPLNKSEFISYVLHRVAEASYQYQELFSKGALNKIYKASKGLPRSINILCHKSLIAAYASGNNIVNKKNAKKAISDTFKAQKTVKDKKKSFKSLLFVLVLALLMLLLGTELFLLISGKL